MGQIKNIKLHIVTDIKVVVRNVRRRTTRHQRRSSTRKRRSSLLCLSTTRLMTTARSLVYVESVLQSRVVQVCLWHNISIVNTVVDVHSPMSLVSLASKLHSECLQTTSCITHVCS